MEQNFQNGTDFGTKPQVSAETCPSPSDLPKSDSPKPLRITYLKEPYGWRQQHLLCEFTKTILGLSEEEEAVLDAVRSFPSFRSAAIIAKLSEVNRKKTNRILKSFEKRKLVFIKKEPGKRDRWRYNRKISRLRDGMLDRYFNRTFEIDPDA